MFQMSMLAVPPPPHTNSTEQDTCLPQPPAQTSPDRPTDHLVQQPPDQPPRQAPAPQHLDKPCVGHALEGLGLILEHHRGHISKQRILEATRVVP